MDLAIKDTTLLTMKNDTPTIIENGAIGVSFDKIDFVGKTRDLEEANYSKVLKRPNHVTMPGLIDSHIHSGLTILRGTAQDVPEKEWMDKALGPITKHMDNEDKLAGSKLGVLEGLRSGTTTFSEFTSDLEEIIEKVYRPYGARVVGAETINEVVDSKGDVYTLERAEEKLKKTEELFKRYSQSDMIELMYGPQALDMVTIDTLKIIYERALEKNRPVHMHVAQGGREKEQIKKRFGTTTVEKLDEENMLGKNLLAAHCHATTKEEKNKMVENDVKMVGCPSSIVMIDGIVPPIKEYLEIGGIVGIGSDQAPGNGAHNLFREMRTINILTKCKESDPASLKPWETLLLATKMGARAIGLEESIGSLEEGKKADIITVDMGNLNLTPTIHDPFHNIIPNLVYSSTGFEVNDVIINGKKIIINGSFIEIDENKIKDKLDKRAKDLLKRSEDDWISADSSMVKYQRDGHI